MNEEAQIDEIRAVYLKWKADDCTSWQAMAEIATILSGGELE
jgi:hypothetical protein